MNYNQDSQKLHIYRIPISEFIPQYSKNPYILPQFSHSYSPQRNNDRSKNKHLAQTHIECDLALSCLDPNI